MKPFEYPRIYPLKTQFKQLLNVFERPMKQYYHPQNRLKTSKYFLFNIVENSHESNLKRIFQWWELASNLSLPYKLEPKLALSFISVWKFVWEKISNNVITSVTQPRKPLVWDWRLQCTFTFISFLSCPLYCSLSMEDLNSIKAHKKDT